MDKQSSRKKRAVLPEDESEVEDDLGQDQKKGLGKKAGE